MSTSSAITRLNNDLNELKKHPLVGANALPSNDNMLIWYGIIMAYDNVPIRFTLEFTNDYPNKAPNAYFDTFIRYQNGASYNDASGRMVVCLNLFGNFNMIHREWGKEASGWSASYTVSSILVSMQGLMLSDMLSKDPEDIKKTRESAFSFKCEKSGHDGSKKDKWFPQIINTEDEISKLMKETYIYDPYKDFYVCYVNKSNMADGAQLGFGIHVENVRIGMLSSPCEYLSIDAFNNGTRSSSTNKQFEFWLPVNNNKLLIEYVNVIAKAINIGNQPEHFKVLKICSSVMNSLSVEILNAGNKLTANDKFINGYFTFYKLMKEYSVTNNKIIEYVDSQIKIFIDKEQYRTKEYINNLGELLIYLTISNYTWNDISKYFIQENDCRNVFWYAVGNKYNKAKYPELKDKKNVKGRSDKVFNATEISRNLVMFQVKFSLEAKKITLDMLKENYDLAPKDLVLELKDTYNKVIKVDTWNKYFDWLSLPNKTENERDLELVDAVTRSLNQKYHN